MVARILDIPLVTITQSCYHTRAKYKPQRYWIEHDTPLFDKSVHTINTIFHEYGVPLLDCFEELFIGNMTLIPSFPEFDLLSDYKADRDKTYFIGPILWDGLYKKDFVNDLQQDKPLIFCYGGQLHDYAGSGGLDFVNAIVEVCADVNANVLLSIDNGANYQYKHKNLIIKNWVPVEYAHRNSDLIICHGGHVSCMGLFKYAVPGIILATHTEREYNARLVQALGAGILIEKNNYSNEVLRHAIFSLLKDKSYSKTVKKYSDHINSNYKNGEIIAANHISSLLDRGKFY